MKNIFSLILLILLFGCGDNIQVRKRNLRQIEPGTIAYRYASIGIAIDETKIGLEELQKNKEKITKCFGEDNYKEIEIEVKDKINLLESDRPYYLTKLVFGDASPWSQPKPQNLNNMNLIAESIEKCLTQQSEAKRLTTETPETRPVDNASIPSGNTTLDVEIQVRVPDLSSDCQQNPEKALEILGLKSNHESIHGPIDSDAGSIGCAYRQNPTPGTLVNKGSTVSFRSWWEGS